MAHFEPLEVFIFIILAEPYMYRYDVRVCSLPVWYDITMRTIENVFLSWEIA